MTDITKGNHFLKIPLTLLISPEFNEIMRRLSLSRAETAGRLLLFFEFLYKRPNKPFRASYIDDQFGNGFCGALIAVGWGHKEKYTFTFAPPKGLDIRPPKSKSGKSILNLCPRDEFGRFLPSGKRKRKPTIYRSDAEGNPIGITEIQKNQKPITELKNPPAFEKCDI